MDPTSFDIDLESGGLVSIRVAPRDPIEIIPAPRTPILILCPFRAQTTAPTRFVWVDPAGNRGRTIERPAGFDFDVFGEEAAGWVVYQSAGWRLTLPHPPAPAR